jgi:hypothetical protein
LPDLANDDKRLDSTDKTPNMKQVWQNGKVIMKTQQISKDHVKNGKKPFNQKHLGQGLVEYSIILSLIAVVVMVPLMLFGSSVKGALCGALISLNPELSTRCIADVEETEVPEGQPHSISAIAVYSPSRGSVFAAARIPEDIIAGLRVDGHGDMQYLPNADVFVIEIPTENPPETVTIRSSEGASVIIDVLRR